MHGPVGRGKGLNICVTHKSVNLRTFFAPPRHAPPREFFPCNAPPCRLSPLPCPAPPRGLKAPPRASLASIASQRLDLNSQCKLVKAASICGNWTVTGPVCIISNKIPKWFSSPNPLQSSFFILNNAKKNFVTSNKFYSLAII